MRPIAQTAHFALHRCSVASAAQDGLIGSRKILFVKDQASIGAMVPKRWAKRAVTRNLFRRQIHHVSVRHVELFPIAAHVIRLRSAFDSKAFVSAASSALRTLVALELLTLIRLAASVDLLDLQP